MSEDRTTVGFWDEQIRDFDGKMRPVLNEYRLFARWFDGHMSGGIHEKVGYHLGAQSMVVDSNLHHMVVRSSMAQLFFRAPRFLVEPFETFNATLFTSDLARVETMLLNDWVIEVDLFHEIRRCLLDAFLGPEMILKIGYSADIATDTELVDKERLKAQRENQEILSGGKPRVRSDSLHSIYLDELERLLGQIKRTEAPATVGQDQTVEVPEETIDFVQGKIKRHREVLEERGEFPHETIRSERVFAHRVSPLRFFYDKEAESPARREWVGEMFMVPVDQVRNDPRYNKDVRAKVSPSTDERLETDTAEERRSRDHVVIYEIVDLRAGKVITYAKDAQKPLRVVDYKLKHILPAGPYVTSSFSVSALTDMGIPPPRIYRDEQAAYTLLKSTQVQAARRSTPMLGVNSQRLSKDTRRNLKSGRVGFLLDFDQLAPGEKISDVLQPVPTLDISPEIAAVTRTMEHDIERLSGLGSARAGGGDFSRTATASAIVSESVNSLSDDLASVLDDFLSRVGREALRLQRRFYTRGKVGELVGQEAMHHWPFDDEEDGGSGWSDNDIKSDRGVNVVPGSTKRANTAVEQKLLVDLYAAIAQNPAIPPSVQIEILQRVLHGAGLYGIDLAGAKELMEVQQAQALAGPQGAVQGGQGGPRTGERVDRRQRERGTEASRASTNQSAQNPGGGRVPRAG